MKAAISKEFTGIFKEEFENFLEYKKALGQYKNIEGKLLYDYLALNRFLDTYELKEIILTEEMTSAYLELGEQLSQSTRHHHECNIRQFAKFLKMQGYENIYVQYDCAVKMPREYTGTSPKSLILQGIDGLRMYFYTGFTRFEKTEF